FLCVALFFAMPVAAADQMHCPATAPTLKVSPSKNPKYQNITGHFCGYFWGIVSLDIADLGNGKFKVEFIYPKYLNSPEYMDATYDAHIDSSGKLTFETFANNRSATVTVWADSSSVYGH